MPRSEVLILSLVASSCKPFVAVPCFRARLRILMFCGLAPQDLSTRMVLLIAETSLSGQQHVQATVQRVLPSTWQRTCQGQPVLRRTTAKWLQRTDGQPEGVQRSCCNLVAVQGQQDYAKMYLTLCWVVVRWHQKQTFQANSCNT
ncbi:hypothetical protein EJ03DRAFT_153176 [Teratosphaeria nubilosa]|uniref:Uncharacterized protein n=1 Tax=Teratosphaeria nubilosa TaxID=161662 RepID=A0A6G1LKX8_9PEZI|nr:hypothetical protein EJ03DRAFT_153176 [Teratosphaeria nubilosa]